MNIPESLAKLGRARLLPSRFCGRRLRGSVALPASPFDEGRLVSTRIGVNTTFHRPISSSAPRLAGGILAAALFATSLSAQQVSTDISSGLLNPSGVAIDAGDNVYIADGANNCIAKYVPSTGALTSLAGLSGVQNVGTNNGWGPYASFSNPQGIVAARGGLVVADQGNQELRLVTFGGYVTNLVVTNAAGAPYQFSNPVGIAADTKGDLFVADEGANAIVEIDANNFGTNVVTNGYKFNGPQAVAVDDAGNLWVADTGNHVICLIRNQSASVVAGISGMPGTNDAPPAINAQFNLPGGLLWVSASQSLLIADTGNNTLRSLFLTNLYGSSIYAVQTVAGVSGQAGSKDGVPAVATFSGPVGLCLDPTDFGYYVVDSGSSELRVFQAVAPPPIPAAPVLGYVTFVAPNASSQPLSVFNASSSAVFNNTAIIAIKGQPNTQTFITSGPTADASSIPLPGPGSGLSPQLYDGDGLTYAAPSIVSPQPDITIYAVSEGPGGRLSVVVSGRYEFLTANPGIVGTSAADIQLTDITSGAAMYYTIDGSIPVDGATTNCFGPIYSGGNLSLAITSNTVLSVRAFTNDYAPSGTASLTLALSNYVPSTVGFAPISKYGGTGATLAIPVYVTLAQSNALLESFQFLAAVTPTGGNTSMVAPLTALSFSPSDYLPFNGGAAYEFFFQASDYTEGSSQEILVNTYTNSGLTIQGHGALSLLEIPIPKTVTKGQTYSLSILNPSGTSDGNQSGVALLGLNTTLTITDPVYFAGDSSPANGYNAGEFGDGSLDNGDVNNAMYASVGIRVPPVFTDAYNDMDVYPPDNGDGLITFLDWETILQRSVGLDTNNWIRFRADGGALMHQQVSWKPGGTPIPLSAPEPMMPAISKTSGGGTPPGQVWLRQALVGAVPQTGVQPGSTCSIPVYAKIGAGYSVSGLQFRAIVTAEGAAPAPGAITFTPAAGVQNPTKLPGNSANDIACFWELGAIGSSLQGSNYLGVITFQVPTNAQTGQSYALHFLGVDGAADLNTPYQFESLPGQVWVNSAALQPPQISSDEWRAFFFGSVTNSLAADNVDADGDGMANWQEYLAGTNPTNAQSRLQFTTAGIHTNGVSGIDIGWLTAPGKTYILEASPVLGGTNWVGVNTNMGDGNNYQFVQTNNSGPARFYQLRLQP